MCSDSKQYNLPDDLNLNLPDAPDFISEPPKFTLLEMIQICEKMLPFWNKQRFEQQGFKNGKIINSKVITEEFVLE
jgi:hypothetical protein